MNKNKVFLSSILIVLILLGAYFVFSAHDRVTKGAIKTMSVPFNWTGGTQNVETINFTINNSNATGGLGSIWQINITIPNNFTIGNATNGSGTEWWNGSSTTFNVTRRWGFQKIENVVVFTALGRNAPNATNMTLIKPNLAMIVWFNVTVTDDETESSITWNITTFDNTTSMGKNQTLITTHGVDTKGPRLAGSNNVSVTNGSKSLSIAQLNGSQWFGNGSNLTFTVALTETNNDTVLLCYNTTNIINKSYLTKGEYCYNVSMTDNSGKNYSVTLNRGNLTHNTNFSFIVFANDTLGNFKYINNTHGGNVTTFGNYPIGAAFAFRIDGTLPKPKLTEPNDKIIDTLRSIKYKCTGTDNVSGIDECKLVVTKPNGDKIEKKDCGKEKEFKNSDTNKPGTYKVYCEVTNGAGMKERTDAKEFKVFYSMEGAPDAEEGVSFDVDFSTSDVKKKIFKKGQGSSVDFTMDGSTPHTITFDTIGTETVKLTIASIPNEIELSVGESVDIDVDENGVDDIRVTLNEIEGGQGEISVEVIRDIVPGEKEVTPEERQEEEAKAKSGIGLLIAIVVIIIGVVVYFLVRPKKK